ncbi:MAG TPA: DUF6599 family protein [Terriglobales bacterium]|nr:DUF6599 family protein [Terriglobales bacterium]
MKTIGLFSLQIMMKPALLVFSIITALIAGAQNTPPLLPEQFGGWQKSADQRSSTNPADADAAFAAVLKEYGFQDSEAATYTRPGRKLSFKVARFADTTGAYGAFTFYKQLGMLSEEIGDQAASANDRVLFYRGNVLAEAQFDRVTAMSAAELRELAATFPAPTGTNVKLPTLPTYLPRQGYVAHSAKYVLGPTGLANVNSPLDAALVDFSRGAEVVLGRYSTPAGNASLVLISYPTPAIAAERLRIIEAALQPATGKPVNAVAKRTGPIVALVIGSISPSEAKSLLASINYDAEVTWNENTFTGKKNNIGNLVIAAFTLIGILLAVALVIGVALGGVRVLEKRFLPNRVSRREEADIIRLNLES